MEEFYNMWEPVLRSFKENHEDLSERVVDWYPSGYLELTIKLNDGTRLTYDLVDDRIKYLHTIGNNKKIDNERMWRNNFSSNLRNRMRKMGMSQLTLSDLSGISNVTISKYLNAGATPSAYNLDRMAYALKCSRNELTDVF